MSSSPSETDHEGVPAPGSQHSVDPRDGSTVASYDEHGPEEVERRLASAAAAQPAWRARGLEERVAVLSRLADLLDEQRDDLAELMTTEMGKTLVEARSEVEKCAWVCRHYAEHGADVFADERVDTEATQARVQYEPLGVVLAVMPWNYPLWQVFRFLAPNLTLGNVGLLKHASNVPGCALAIERLVREAGAPDGVFTTLLVSSSAMPAIVGDARVAAATLTGSEPAGRAVAEQAGRLLKKVVLELGGSDPFVVLDDADLDRAAEVAVDSRMLNNGQSCIAAKRFIVVDAVADEFTRLVADRMRALVLGDPMDEDTDLGPMAREDLRDELQDQVRRTVEAGATLAVGGGVPDRPGWFHEATLLTDVTPDMPAATEETFGPAAVVIRVADADEAVAVANATDFGLGASLWTQDRDTAEALVGRLEAGMVFVNQLVKSDPRLPFGGIKNSGHGRELASLGAREFANVKTVWID